MTKFADKSFSSRPATDAYRKGWGVAFGDTNSGANVSPTFASKSDTKRREALRKAKKR